jgi:hypothetical protein
MSGATVNGYRWWLEARGDAHNALTSLLSTMRTEQSERRRGLDIARRMFGNQSAQGTSTFGGLSLNIVKAISCTARADLCKGAAPRPMFVTSGADYALQRQAQQLTKAVAGVFYASKFDKTARSVALHSVVYGDGLVKVFAENERVEIQRIDPREVWVDEEDGSAGDPRSMYHEQQVDRSVLKERHPGHGEDIENAPNVDPDSLTTYARRRLSDRVTVIEAWHLPSGPKARDGRHVIAVEGATLLDERWTDDSFPFVRMPWTEPLDGFWAKGVADELRQIQIEINETIQSIRKALKLCAVPRVFLERSSKVLASHLSNEPGEVVYYQGTAPVFDVARAVSPELVAQLDRLWQRAFQLTGVSEMNASAMKPAGLDSGKALRVYADIASARFSAWGKAFQDFYLEVSAQVVKLMGRLCEKNPRLEVVYHDEKRKRIERIEWANVALEEDAYVLQAFPVSSLPDTPAGRIAFVQEMAEAQWIDPTTAKRLLNFPDLESEMSLDDAPRDILEQLIDRMLGDGVYAAPEPFYDLALCMRVATLHYMKAQTQDVPDERLDLLRRFLVATQALIAAQTPPEPAAPPPEGMPAEEAGVDPMSAPAEGGAPPPAAPMAA